MFEESKRLPVALLTGVAAGLLAGAAVGRVDKWTGRMVAEEQKRREKQVRDDSAHRMAGPYFGRKILGRELSEDEENKARAAFGATYGVVWGLIYAALRERFPSISKYYGLPFAVPFFFACDGTMAPLLGVTPGIQRLPWQINAQEMGNHIVWTIAAETVHRLAESLRENGAGEALSKPIPDRRKEASYE